MRLPELPRCTDKRGHGLHLVCGVMGARGKATFCGVYVGALVQGSDYRDVCPRCVRRAKFWGLHE